MRLIICLQNFNGGAQPTTDDVWAFYQEVMPWIMETSWIKGAFPFGPSVHTYT